VVARQEVHRDRHVAERLQGAGHGAAVHLVRLEGVAAHQHEAAPLGRGDAAQGADGVEPRLGVPLLGPLVQEVPPHPQLPVARVEKTNHRRPLIKIVSPYPALAGIT